MGLVHANKVFMMKTSRYVLLVIIVARPAMAQSTIIANPVLKMPKD